MLIRNVRHKGLKRFIATGGSAGLPAASVEKIRTILTFLESMGSADELESLPIWKPHQLEGRGTAAWALHVTKNWRITFVIEHSEIIDLDFEDYH